MNRHFTREKIKVYLAGFILMVLFWMVDAIIDAHFGNGSTMQQLFAPDRHEFSMRLAAAVLLIAFFYVFTRILANRRKLEQALEVAVSRAELEKERSDAILENMGDAISIQDPDFRVIYQNRAHIAMTGIHTGEYCYAAYQHQTSVCDGCHLARSFADGQTHFRETSTVTDKGTQYVEIISTPLKDTDGKIIACIEAVRDVTPRKMLEEERRKNLAAIEGAMDGMAILDGDERFIYLNRAHAGLYGYDSPAELIGKSWRVLYDDAEVARMEQAVFPEFRHNGSWRGEARGKKPDGSTFPQEVSLTVSNEGYLVCIVRDITERKRREAEIRELNESLLARTIELSATNKELEAFSYSLSHDLRTLLTQIFIAAQALEEGHLAGLDENGRFFAAAIRNASENMEDLLEAMLVLSGVTRSELRVEEVNLSLLAEEVVSGLRSAEPDREAAFVADPDLVVCGDRQLLKAALENMLGNAWKYTRKSAETRIEFGVTACAGERVFFIRDNGAGFAMKEADKLFQPFKRLHTANEFSGTGVGLATVQRVIERHGGRIWGTGEVGKGATFYFTLAVLS